MHVTPTAMVLPGIGSEHLIRFTKGLQPPIFVPIPLDHGKKTRIDRDIITLDDHLCNASASQGLASNEFLASNGGKRVEKSSDDKENGCSNQTASSGSKTNPLDSTKDGVNGSPHPVGGETADEIIEFRGCWANSKKERYFNKENDKG